MVKMAIYTQKSEQKWLKINDNRGGGGWQEVGIKMSWVEKNRKINKINNYLGLESTNFKI